MNKVEMHKKIVLELNDTYKRKNNDYGDSFAAVRGKVDNAILVRLWDKLLRLETLMSGKQQQVNDESIEDTLADLANYAIMELVERRAIKEPMHICNFRHMGKCGKGDCVQCTESVTEEYCLEYCDDREND